MENLLIQLYQFANSIGQAQWSDLTTSLFSLDQSLSFALMGLAIWTRLAECLGEDSKDLTAARRREIAQGIARHFEEPSEAW